MGILKEANKIQIEEAVKAFLYTGRKEIEVILFNEDLNTYIQMVISSGIDKIKYQSGDHVRLASKVKKLYNDFCEKVEDEILVFESQNLICVREGKICYVTFSFDV